MGGGLIQLVAYGAQDVYLTGNPQITFFKVVYRRHTNFAREAIEQVFDGSASLGNSVVCTLSRSGDLVNSIYLTATYADGGTATDGSVMYLGHALIKTCEVEIGGQRIDKHYSRWLQIWSELNGSYDTVDEDSNVTIGQSHHAITGYGKMIAVDGCANGKTHKLYVPLRFWFCNNPGLALPLIALQYHEVKIKMTFETDANLGGQSATAQGSSISDTKLIVDYIYLDTDERRRFAQVSHEYLIEQVQHEGTVATVAATNTQNVTVNYNHPVKYIAWAVETGSSGWPLGFKRQAPLVDEATTAREGTAKLLLNGNDRFEERKSDYFTRVQPYQHFNASIPSDRIGVYSFANNPNEHQPSGTCNFSRIDSAIWQFKWANPSNGPIATTDNLWMFAVNYNVLRIMSGMGGLAYSN